MGRLFDRFLSGKIGCCGVTSGSRNLKACFGVIYEGRRRPIKAATVDLRRKRMMRHLGILFALAALLLANTAEAGNKCCKPCKVKHCKVQKCKVQKCHYTYCAPAPTCCAPAPTCCAPVSSCNSCSACSAPVSHCGGCNACGTTTGCSACGTSTGCGAGGCGVITPSAAPAAPAAAPAVEEAPAPPAAAPAPAPAA